MSKTSVKEIIKFRDFPDGPSAKTLHFNSGGPGYNPGRGTRPHMSQQKFSWNNEKILHDPTKTSTAK